MDPITILAAFVIGGAAPAQQAQPTAPDRFVDVPVDHWAYQAVVNLRKRGILVGYPDGQLRGKRTVTRYEAANGLSKFVTQVEGSIPKRGSSTAPGIQGPPGPRGAPGPAGPAGPPGEHPREVDLFRQLVQQFKSEVVDLRKQMDQATANSEGLSKEVEKTKDKPKP